MIEASSTNIVEGIEIERESLQIHHLQFADDTILFPTLDTLAIDNLFGLVETFRKAFGLNINLKKLEIIGITLSMRRRKYIANKFGCRQGQWLNVYLRLLLFGKLRSKSFWVPIVEKIERRLHPWNDSHISKGGRLTLLQVMLSNLSTYYLSFFKTPLTVALNIERLYRNFLWKGRSSQSGSHLLDGILSLDPHIMEASDYKKWWRRTELY